MDSFIATSQTFKAGKDIEEDTSEQVIEDGKVRCHKITPV